MTPTADTPESLLGDLLDGSHLAQPDRLPDVITEAAARVGWDVVLYLVDDDELALRPQVVDGKELPEESVDGSLACLLYTSDAADE